MKHSKQYHVSARLPLVQLAHLTCCENLYILISYGVVAFFGYTISSKANRD